MLAPDMRGDDHVFIAIRFVDIEDMPQFAGLPFGFGLKHFLCGQVPPCRLVVPAEVNVVMPSLPGAAGPLETGNGDEDARFVEVAFFPLLDLPVFRGDHIGIALIADEMNPGDISGVTIEPGNLRVEHQLPTVRVRPKQAVWTRLFGRENRSACRMQSRFVV